MRLDKLFKVLVIGGTVLTAGCFEGERDATPGEDVAAVDAQPADPDATPRADDAGFRDAARRDGVSSWMSWFTPIEEPDAGAVADDSGAADAQTDAAADVAGDDGVQAWLSWA